MKKIKTEDALIKILSSPDHSNKSWITDQYDQVVMCDTLQKSGGDSAVIRIHNSNKAIAVTCDCNPIYCNSDPKLGAEIGVAESWRNLIASGADPISITDNLNFAQALVTLNDQELTKILEYGEEPPPDPTEEEKIFRPPLIAF